MPIPPSATSSALDPASRGSGGSLVRSSLGRRPIFLRSSMSLLYAMTKIHAVSESRSPLKVLMERATWRSTSPARASGSRAPLLRKNPMSFGATGVIRSVHAHSAPLLLRRGSSRTIHRSHFISVLGDADGVPLCFGNGAVRLTVAPGRSAQGSRVHRTAACASTRRCGLHLTDGQANRSRAIERISCSFSMAFRSIASPSSR